MVLPFAAFPGAEVAILVMAFAWGATLGSFINVVVHRVPLGRSVVAGASRCPMCSSPIRPCDNVPVLGWILLRGRCRACGTSISPHYPLVEATCGGIAAAIAAVEVLGAGRWLPWLGSGWQHGHGVDRLLMHGDFRILACWALHTGVILVIVAWTLLAPRHRVSPRAACLTIVPIVAAIATLPDIGPPGIRFDGTSWPDDPRTAAFVAMAAGLVIGWGVGGMMAGPNDRASLAALGAATGWQTLTIVAVVTTVLRRAARNPRGTGRPSFDPLPAVATAAIVGWEPLRRAIMLSWATLGGGSP